MIETVILVIVGVVCGTVLGFWLGRVSAKYYVGEAEEEQTEKNSEPVQEDRHAGSGIPNKLWYERRELDQNGVYSIGSPVNGMIADYAEGRHPEVTLYPAEEKMYAPMGGKVVRLFPLGNEILFRTEEGSVLRMKVGTGVDELQSEYFRLKVIQNEVVNKGKLLLEFDKNALEEEGVECTVSVRIEEVGLGDKVQNVTDGRVKVGEAIFEISRM